MRLAVCRNRTGGRFAVGAQAFLVPTDELPAARLIFEALRCAA